MSDHEKDRLGDKLHDVEAAREEQWAHKRDQELLDKMRKKLGEAAALPCPRCKKPLEPRAQNGIGMLACPSGDGAWLDSDVLKAVLKPRK
jgi:Transcription factor zinc-finger